MKKEQKAIHFTETKKEQCYLGNVVENSVTNSPSVAKRDINRVLRDVTKGEGSRLDLSDNF